MNRSECMRRELYLGIDGGGSKTLAVVTDRNGAPLGEGRAGPANHLRVGLEEATLQLRAATDAAMASVKATPEEIEYAYFGLAGADHPKHRRVLITAIRAILPRGNFIVDNDARIALTGAIGFGAGIVVIAGTGSVAFGRSEDGREERAGGWGPTLGDEGSGYSIARRGLTAIVRAYDGRGPDSSLTELLCSRYNMCDPDELPYFVYAPTTHADDIAFYCRMVIDAAKNGDAVAREILNSEASELGLTAAAVAKRLGLLEHRFPIAFVGGVFNAGELITKPLQESISSKAPHAEFIAPLATPAVGAAKMAVYAAESARVRP